MKRIIQGHPRISANGSWDQSRIYKMLHFANNNKGITLFDLHPESYICNQASRHGISSMSLVRSWPSLGPMLPPLPAPKAPQRGQSPPWPSGRRFPPPANVQGGRSDTVRDSHPRCSRQREGDFFWKGKSLHWCLRSAGTPPATIAEDGEVPSSVGVTGTSAVTARAVRSRSKGWQQREMQLMLKRCQRREAGSPWGAAPLSRHLKIINQQGCKAGLWARGRDGLQAGCFLPCSSHPPLCKHPEHTNLFLWDLTHCSVFSAGSEHARVQLQLRCSHAVIEAQPKPFSRHLNAEPVFIIWVL